MPPTLAFDAAALILAISGGVGVFLQRYRSSCTEMVGMMVGMALGMMTGIAVGYVVGAATDMFVSNMVGVVVGVVYGALFGRLGGLMGILDGAMGGMMGGVMVAMLGVMLQYDGVAILATAGLVAALYGVALAGVVVLVRQGGANGTVLDVVCGMQVDPRLSRTLTHAGNAYYFCAPSCKRAFERNPSQFLAS